MKRVRGDAASPGSVLVSDRRFCAALLRWFRQSKRPLPWRESTDPYRIWVSEIMLQQTQVATVLPYFVRFLQSFPTLADLAAASEQEVLRLWEGLGYYRRARSLHQAAQILVRDFDGQVPRDAAALARLPGIGRYTLGAILSQAFDERWPAVDANVARVLCRLGAWREPLNSTRSQRWLDASARAILPTRRIGEFNQALMELGALVCKPRRPECLLCPVRSWCRAASLGLQEHLPAKHRDKAVVAVEEVAAVVRRKHGVLVVQRPQNAARWAGLWEFPHDTLRDGESPAEALHRLVADCAGLAIRVIRHLGTVSYAVTRFRYRMQIYAAEWVGGRLRPRQYATALWVDLARLAEFPMSAPQRRVARLIGVPPIECPT